MGDYCRASSVVRIELPTPDVVAVRHANGLVTVFADVSLSEQRVAAALAALDMSGVGHALG